MNTTIRKNPYSKNGITCTLYDSRVSGSGTNDCFTNRIKVFETTFHI